MLRFILMSLLIPLLQRALPALIKGAMSGMAERREREEAERHGQTDYQPPDENLPTTMTGRVHKIVDGDSLYITGHQPQIRLWGVDAPERHEPGYNEATQMLRELAFDQTVKIKTVSSDKYGRTLGRCYFQNGDELNLQMIQTGVVKEYFRFTKGVYSRKD